MPGHLRQAGRARPRASPPHSWQWMKRFSPHRVRKKATTDMHACHVCSLQPQARWSANQDLQKRFHEIRIYRRDSTKPEFMVGAFCWCSLLRRLGPLRTSRLQVLLRRQSPRRISRLQVFWGEPCSPSPGRLSPLRISRLQEPGGQQQMRDLA